VRQLHLHRTGEVVALIRRDPWARIELHRATVSPSWSETCAWCGNRNGHGKLFRYRIESDSGRKSEDAKLFCSVTCRDSYY
jgi:hypothetical protein